MPPSPSTIRNRVPSRFTCESRKEGEKEKIMETRELSQECEAALTLLQMPLYDEEEQRKSSSSSSSSSSQNPKPVVLPSHPGHAQLLNLSLRNFDPPDYPPVMSLMGLIGDCSVPYRKKLTKTDMRHDQARLSINKDYVEKSLLKLLNEDEVIEKGIPVTVYDIKGGIYNMNFRVWSKNKSMYVLMKGWKNFCIQHKLRHHDDFLIFVTLWMFRHVQTGKLCFIVSPETLPPLLEPSKRRRTVKKDIEEVTNLD